MKNKIKKSGCISVVVLLSAGVLLRFFNIGARSFWCDEFLAISLARLSLADMSAWALQNDAHPPLFYGIGHFLFGLTRNEAGLRMVSALFSSGALIVFYKLLKVSGIKYYTLALSLFVLSPAAILWSQMLKSYGMLTFFVLLSTYYFFKLKNDRRLSSIFVWVASSIAAVYLHNYGSIVIIAQFVTFLLYKKSFRSRTVFLAFVFIFFSYLPYVAGPIFQQISFASGAYHTVTDPFLRVAYTFYYFAFGETLSPLNLKFFIPSAVLFFFFFIKGLASHKSNMLATFSVIILVSVLPLFFLMKSTIPQNIVHLQPFFFVLVASGAHSFRKRWVRNSCYFGLAACLLPPVYYYYRGESLQFHDVSKLVPYRQVSMMIEDSGRHGEAVIFTEPRERRFAEFFLPYSPWDWYYGGSLPLIEVSPGYVEDLYLEMDSMKERYEGFWLVLNYGLVEHQWNDKVKDFFLDGKSVKIMESRLVENYSFLNYLRYREIKKYYFLEVYHIRKDG